MVSISTGNFIKAVYKFQQMGSPDTRPGSIARELGISPAAATDMARKLASRELLAHEKYRGMRLTASGERVALDIIRKHRLWETFLHDVLGLSMHEIHREAEMLEHLTSDFLAEKISAYLGHPKTDPHGDPIPDARGEFETDPGIVVLSEATPGKSYELARLYGSDKEFFDFCQSNQLKVGTTVTVKKQYSKNRLTEIEKGSSRLLMDKKLSDFIYVREKE
jgi:DtxR family Mn-dependent transcriptional regulator